MTDAPSNSGVDQAVTPLFITTWTALLSGFNALAGAGHGEAGPNIVTWQAANQALYMPLRLPWPYYVARAAWHNGVNLGANGDLAIYSQGGAQLWHLGSTAQSGANAPQFFTVGMLLAPGDYYVGFTTDSTGAGHFELKSSSGTGLRFAGCYEQASALPLPSSATFAAMNTTTAYPLLSLTRTASGF